MAKQAELPTMEDRSDEVIEQAAESYRRVRNERITLSKREAELYSALIQTMKNQGRDTYSYAGLIVERSSLDKVKVRKEKEDEDEDEPIGDFVEASADETEAPDGETNRAENETNVEEFLGKKKGKKAQRETKQAENETADDFTADRCEECGRIDGAHKQECSKSSALTFPAYLAFAKAQGMKVPAAAARKLELTRSRDDDVRAWLKQDQQEAGAELEETERQVDQGSRPAR
jgi:hypothetical protein